MISVGSSLGILIGLFGAFLLVIGVQPIVGKTLTSKIGAQCTAAVLGVLAADFGGGWLPKTPLIAVNFGAADSQEYAFWLLLIEGPVMLFIVLFFLMNLGRSMFAAQKAAVRV